MKMIAVPPAGGFQMKGIAIDQQVGFEHLPP